MASMRQKQSPGSGGWAEDASDPEIVDGMSLLAETEGIFTETAGGVTVASAQKLYAQERIRPDETTVLCITGNGLKTTDALAGRFEAVEPIAPKLAAFEAISGSPSCRVAQPERSCLMSVKVSIPSAFRRHTEGADHYDVPLRLEQPA